MKMKHQITGAREDLVAVQERTHEDETRARASLKTQLLYSSVSILLESLPSELLTSTWNLLPFRQRKSLFWIGS